MCRMVVWSGVMVIPLASISSWLSTFKVKLSAVNVREPVLRALEKSNFACKFVKDVLKFALPGNKVRLPEKLTAPDTTRSFRLKFVTDKLGAAKEANVPIDTVPPTVGLKLKLESENPC